MEKQLSVNAIRQGTVIDHIPANMLFKVISILQLAHSTKKITYGTNLDSKKLGKKAIIKVANHFFLDDDINRIALVAPNAKLNIIKDYCVAQKREVSLPETLLNIAKCMNPKCVTNNESIATKFTVLTTQGERRLFCHYCEKETDEAHFDILVKRH